MAQAPKRYAKSTSPVPSATAARPKVRRWSFDRVIKKCMIASMRKGASASTSPSTTKTRPKAQKQQGHGPV